MTVKKFFHSCIAIEENGHRLVIDPGLFSFLENTLAPEDIGSADGILITHSHNDHLYPEAIQRIIALKKAPVFADEEVRALLEKENVRCEVMHGGETRKIGGFEIRAFELPHGLVVGHPPPNLGFLVNGRFFHPGDSLEFPDLSADTLLALPVAAPWLRLRDALEAAKRSGAKNAIPIHDRILRDFMQERVHRMAERFLGEEGIGFRGLAFGDILTL